MDGSFQPRNPNLRLLNLNTTNLNEKKIFDLSEFSILTKLKNFLFKLFMNIPFTTSDVDVSSVEKEIIKLLMKRKKFIGHEDVEFTNNFFNQARNSNLRKSGKHKEDALKFIFKKAIRFLKERFRDENLCFNEKLNGNEFDFKFYSHHYGHVAKSTGKPLECFYHFRNWKTRYSEHIPKSVTKKYVRDLKLNPDFILKIKGFLDEDFFINIKKINLKKIHKMVEKFEKKIQKLGEAEGLNQIRASICSKGFKNVWTLNEILFAREITLDLLNE
jgi:hypothetical protein